MIKHFGFFFFFFSSLHLAILNMDLNLVTLEIAKWIQRAIEAICLFVIIHQEREGKPFSSTEPKSLLIIVTSHS